MLSAALAHTQWRRPDVRLNPSPSAGRQPCVGQDSESRRDGLLTEIEDLVTELKAKVARYSRLKSDPSLNDPQRPDNQAATDWMHEALEDIAATALGVEPASQERLFYAISEADAISRVDRDSTIETNQEPESGNAV